MITGDIEAHLAAVYETRVSRETISKITDGIIEEMDGGLAGAAPGSDLPVVFIDATHLKVRDGLVANRAFYPAIGVTVDGKRDILGIWASSGAEGAKLVGSAHRDPQPRCHRCVHRLLRRAQRPARGDQHHRPAAITQTVCCT
jgi:transposase-like protein